HAVTNRPARTHWSPRTTTQPNAPGEASTRVATLASTTHGNTSQTASPTSTTPTHHRSTTQRADSRPRFATRENGLADTPVPSAHVPSSQLRKPGHLPQARWSLPKLPIGHSRPPVAR